MAKVLVEFVDRWENSNYLVFSCMDDRCRGFQVAVTEILVLSAERIKK